MGPSSIPLSFSASLACSALGKITRHVHVLLDGTNSTFFTLGLALVDASKKSLITFDLISLLTLLTMTLCSIKLSLDILYFLFIFFI